MKKLKIILLMGFFSTLFGCQSSEKNDNIKLKNIVVPYEDSEGFKDIVLQIIKVEKTKDSHIYLAKGIYEAKIVGLKFEIKSEIPKGLETNGKPDAKNGFFTNGIKITSIGKESDELIKSLSKLYGFKTDNGFSKTSLTPTAFSLNSIDVNLDNPNYYKFKLFFNDGDNDSEDDYCEIFFNINTNEKIIELFEKDEEYRKNLIETFSKS